MKRVLLLITFITFSITSYSQYRWEVSGGATFSSINIDNAETSRGTGFYINAGYGYVMGVRAKTSIVFSLELLQRTSAIDFSGQSVFSPNDEGFIRNGDVKVLQVGFNPKFRFLTGEGKDRFRGFVNVGPSFRVNTNFEIGGEELEDGAYEKLIIGGVYGVGFSQMLGEMFDIMAEVGVMNDFIDNLTVGNSKFFDVYARVGLRFRIYDARR